MKTIEQIKQDREAAQSELFKQVRLFWAFSNEQLKKGMEEINHQEGEKIVHIGMGGYLPKSNVDTFLNGMEKLNKDYKAAIKAHKLRPKLIAYELANYECYYTGDINPALSALGSEYTYEEVYTVYRATLKEWEQCNA